MAIKLEMRIQMEKINLANYIVGMIPCRRNIYTRKIQKKEPTLLPHYSNWV